jgi:EAL domain-containing protein (putative c-di-GMP-specific phosphodiesterase class I)
MACQHTLFEPGESQGPLLPGYQAEMNFPVLFQPIVDTFEHRVLAHQCLIRSNGEPATAIHSAARQAPQGLYFLKLLPSFIDDPALDMSSTIAAVYDSGMKPGHLVFEMAGSDLARDPAHSQRIREYLRKRGFGFALSRAGADSFQSAGDFAPDYIKLDRRLIQNFDQPVCAPAISKLVQIAEKSGAHVVAEGVDRVRTVENLWLLGVRLMQGHLFGDASPRIAATLGFAP